MTVYLLNGKDKAIEMSRQCNIEVENQCEKNILEVIRMESINLIVQKYVWKVKYQTTAIFTSI